MISKGKTGDINSENEELLPSSNPAMGSGLADHDLAVEWTARNELWMKESDSSWEDRDALDEVLAQLNRDIPPHFEKAPPPVTPPSKESDRPLLPSSYPTMGSGLADHDLAVAGTARNELWMKESDLPWEDRDTMRGLGINGPHHVSSSVSVKEVVSRAYAKACQKSGAHERFPEDGANGDASSSSSASVVVS